MPALRITDQKMVSFPSCDGEILPAEGVIALWYSSCNIVLEDSRLMPFQEDLYEKDMQIGTGCFPRCLPGY